MRVLLTPTAVDLNSLRKSLFACSLERTLIWQIRQQDSGEFQQLRNTNSSGDSLMETISTGETIRDRSRSTNWWDRNWRLFEQWRLFTEEYGTLGDYANFQREGSYLNWPQATAAVNRLQWAPSSGQHSGVASDQRCEFGTEIWDRAQSTRPIKRTGERIREAERRILWTQWTCCQQANRGLFEVCELNCVTVWVAV